jgi:hypothetical protein
MGREKGEYALTNYTQVSPGPAPPCLLQHTRHGRSRRARGSCCRARASAPHPWPSFPTRPAAYAPTRLRRSRRCTSPWSTPPGADDDVTPLAEVMTRCHGSGREDDVLCAGHAAERIPGTATALRGMDGGVRQRKRGVATTQMAGGVSADASPADTALHATSVMPMRMHGAVNSAAHFDDSFDGVLVCPPSPHSYCQ